MKKIYISIPISGHDYKAQRAKADLIAASLSREGWKPVTPFSVYAGKSPGYFDYICADLRALADCDAVFFCRGWQDSLGCNIEHDFVVKCINFNKKKFNVIYEKP